MTVGEDKAASGQLPPLFNSSLNGSEMCLRVPRIVNAKIGPS
jgi:hypothetical protein